MRKKILIFLIIVAILGIVSKVSALETTWPPSPFGTNLTDDSALTDMVKYFYEWGIFLGGLAVLISLLIGGFLYLTSVGNPTRMGEAKDRIFSAIIGLVLLFSIYLILNTINPELTVISMPPMGAKCTTDADCLCVGGKCGGTGSSCASDADCPYVCQGGICMIKMSVGCSTDDDCPEPNPDPDPEKNYICKNKQCVARCIEVLFCDTTGDCNPGTETFSSGITDCKDISGTIKSINIRGACLVSLFKTKNNCPTNDPNEIVGPFSSDIKDIQKFYDQATFESVKIEEISY
jgi:hypothetical protein